MKRDEDPTPSPAREQTADRPETERVPYAPPRLERLGGWSVLTLQQSIRVGPGDW